MSDNKKFVVILFGTLFTVLVVMTIIWYWQYQSFPPRPYPNTAGSRWYAGYLHGVFIIPNFIIGLTDSKRSIFQAGAGMWYKIWFILGLLAAFGGGKATTRR